MVPVLLVLLSLSPAARADDAPPAVLFVGDSHSTQIFGQTLDRDLRSQKGRVATFAVCSSRPQSFLSETEHACGWLFRDFGGREPSKYARTRPGKITVAGKERDVAFVKTPKLSDLLADYAPKAVIVALGSNGLSAASVSQTLALIHGAGAACFWVGPPRMRSVPDAQLDGLYRVLAANKVGPAESPLGDSCRLILDSRNLTYLKYPAQGCDGTHYACPELRPLGRQWGTDAYNRFVEALQP